MRYLLAGNPNCGKSTLFNRLTGLRQKTGNFQGVTVEKKIGIFSISSDESVEIWDLPGAYSLNGISEDKQVTAKILLDHSPEDRILFVMDATQIERSFQFLTSIIDTGSKVLVAVTMKDLLNRRGIGLDLAKLQELTGIHFHLLNAKTGEGLEELKILIQDRENFSKGKKLWESSGATSTQDELIAKSIGIKKILSQVLTLPENLPTPGMQKADRILLHPIWGIGIFLGLMALVFQFLFTWAELPMDWIESGIGLVQEFLGEILTEGPLSALLIDGAIEGVGAVVVFIPQLALLFFFLGLMEESGYMARASFVMDRVMGKFGLSGKSFIPLLSSAACAVPAIMGARTIENKSDRMATIMVSPLIMCSARYPVYILIIGTVFATEKVWGIFSLQGLALFALFLLGLFTSLGFGLLFKKLVFRETSSYFLMELPAYRMPSFRSLSQNVLAKIKAFLVNAGQIILYISILLWFVSYYPLQYNETGEIQPNIKTSYAAAVGKKIEPIIEPLGFDWKIGISLITSFAAREVMVSTLAIIYEVEDAEDAEENPSLREAMLQDKRIDGTPLWTAATGFSILVFFAFASQCMSTLAVVRKETNSYFWPMVQFLYMTTLAYVSSFLVYQIASRVL